MRVWLRRIELEAMLTRELQKIPGCAGATLATGPQLTVGDFTKCNWATFECRPAPASDVRLVPAVAGGVVSTLRELYNVAD